MRAIEEIYEGYMDSQQIADSAETNTALDEIIYRLGKLLPEEQSSKITDLAVELAAESQKQGFMTGFKLAVRMMNECK